MMHWPHRRIAIINLSHALLAYLGNLFSPIQLFCQPVLWAAIVLVLFVSAFISWHFIRNKWLQGIAMTLQGTGFIACIYCILFIGADYSTAIPGILFFGLGLLAFVPVVFVLQLVYRFIKASKVLKLCWLAGCIVPVVFAAYFARQYAEVCTAVDKTKPSTVKEFAAILDNNYMSERIIGMHFRYHTQICMFDGWRPPLHDPFLVVAMWMNEGQDPLYELFHVPEERHYSNMHLQERILLYRIMFPGRNPQADCVCSWNSDGRSYLKDSRFDPK
jgi:hypothetical protein